MRGCFAAQRGASPLTTKAPLTTEDALATNKTYGRTPSQMFQSPLRYQSQAASHNEKSPTRSTRPARKGLAMM